jgi:hypothetical protein
MQDKTNLSLSLKGFWLPLWYLQSPLQHISFLSACLSTYVRQKFGNKTEIIWRFHFQNQMIDQPIVAIFYCKLRKLMTPVRVIIVSDSSGCSECPFHHNIDTFTDFNCWRFHHLHQVNDRHVINLHNNVSSLESKWIRSLSVSRPN